jgi:EAL domain-containing protein (putative c-di-GMP-specific phosphodiesterase class I)
MRPQRIPDEAISADEIGIETARLGDFILRSAFQPVYQRNAGGLLAVCAEGFLRPFRNATPMPPRPYLASLPAEDRAVAERLAAALHLGNYRHVDPQGLDCVIGVGASPGFADDLGKLLDRAELTRGRITCTFRNLAAFDFEALPGIAQTLRQHGLRIALGGIAGEPPPLELISSVAPNLVRIDGLWFRRVAESEGASRLLPRLVEGFQADGAQVLIEGIETRRQLSAALDAGADLYQGFLLSPPQLAGTATDASQIDFAEMFAGEAKVIPLFGGRR